MTTAFDRCLNIKADYTEHGFSLRDLRHKHHVGIKGYRRILLRMGVTLRPPHDTCRQQAKASVSSP
jgi:hypothetical protein